MRTIEIGAFGKVPTQSDFFRHHAGAPEVGVLDRWLQDGLELAPQLLGSRWQGAYDAARPIRFVLRPRESRLSLLGVAVPSGDAAGRRYPFSVFRLLEGEASTRGWADLPHDFAPFLDAAERLSVEAARGDDDAAGSRLSERVEALSDGGGAEGPGTRASYGDFVHRVRFAELLGGAPGDTAGVDPSAALRGLREVLRSLAASSGRGGLRFGLRAPLGNPLGGGSLELSASWWMDVSARALGPLEKPPVAFWTRIPGESASGRLILAPWTPRFLVCWLDPDGENDRLWDLVPRASGQGSALPAGDDYRELAGAPLAALLDRVGAWTRP